MRFLAPAFLVSVAGQSPRQTFGSAPVCQCTYHCQREHQTSSHLWCFGRQGEFSASSYTAGHPLPTKPWHVYIKSSSWSLPLEFWHPCLKWRWGKAPWQYDLHSDFCVWLPNILSACADGMACSPYFMSLCFLKCEDVILMHTLTTI